MGPSLFDMIKDRRKQMFADESPEEFETAEEPAEYDAPDANGFTLSLKRKRRSTMLKNMLNGAGYGDLAKMINIKER